MEALRLTTADDLLKQIGELVRCCRQREQLTQSELAAKAGVPASSISRLERTGLSSTDALFNVLFALDQVEDFGTFLKERLRLARFPKSLAELGDEPGVVQRVRHRRETT